MFKSSLEQERIFEEIKNGTGNLLINALAGTGKCLGKGTKVMLYNGFFKNVEDIIVGDVLMGDDGTPRNVLNTNVGYDTLYEIKLKRTYESFICNEDHILTCLSSDTKQNKVSNFYMKTDISIKDIINDKENKLAEDNQVIGLTLYRSILDYTGSEIKDFYEYGTLFFENDNVEYKDILTNRKNRYLILSGIIDSYCYPLKNIIVLNEKYNNNKNKDLFIKLSRSLGFRVRFEFNKNLIILGLFNKLTLNNKEYEYFFSGFADSNNKNIYNINKETFFINKLPEKGDYYGFTLDGNGRFIIDDYIVTHNTTTIVKSLDLIPNDKRVLMLAFNKHIANELKERLHNRDNLWISTTHALGWGSIRKKYKNAVIDDNKAYNVINSKIRRWNISEIDNVEEYISMIKKMVDLCRVTLTLDRRFVVHLANNHGYKITDEDGRRILSVIEEMYNDIDRFDFIDMIYLPAIDKKLWLYPNDYVFVDECVFGDNNVITEHGPIRFKTLYKRFVKEKKSWMSQQDIPKALSYNMVTGENEYKNITKIELKGIKKVSKLDLRQFTIYTTPNHLFYTSEGWRETKDLEIGDAIKANGSHLKCCYLPNKDQIDLLTVMYLNEYKFTKQLNTAKFRFYIDNDNTAYFKFISSIIDINIKSYINNHYIEYITLSYYYNNKVTDKEYIISKLTNKQLAFLLMRLYHITNDNKIGFGFKAKNYDEAYYYKDLFEKSIGLRINIKYHKKMYYFIPEDTDKFMERVGKFLTEDYKDVFPKKYHNYIEEYIYTKESKRDPYFIIRNIQHEIKRKKVYDITVQDNHNYYVMGTTNFDSIGSVKWKIKRNNVGILSHNCQDYNRAQQFILNKVIKKDTGRLISVGDENQGIYSFNGSDSNSFNWFREKENTTILPLTTSYRCSKNVIRYAQNIVPSINHKVDAVEGSVRNGSVLEEAQSGDFVLSRTNKPLVFLMFDLLRRNKNASIRGNDIGLSIAKTVKKYNNLLELNTGLTNLLVEKQNQLFNIGITDVFNDPRYIAVQDNIDIIRFLMNNSNSIGDIVNKLGFIFTDNPKGIVLSTIHKSKGLEADNVFIIKPDKIKIPTKISEMWQQEINLEYIAYTRAKVNLIIDTEWNDEDR
jgi:hypothetical protein